MGLGESNRCVALSKVVHYSFFNQRAFLSFLWRLLSLLDGFNLLFDCLNYFFLCWRLWSVFRAKMLVNKLRKFIDVLKYIIVRYKILSICSNTLYCKSRALRQFCNLG